MVDEELPVGFVAVAACQEYRAKDTEAGLICYWQRRRGKEPYHSADQRGSFLQMLLKQHGTRRWSSESNATPVTHELGPSGPPTTNAKYRESVFAKYHRTPTKWGWLLLCSFKAVPNTWHITLEFSVTNFSPWLVSICLKIFRQCLKNNSVFSYILHKALTFYPSLHFMQSNSLTLLPDLPKAHLGCLLIFFHNKQKAALL